MDTPTRRFLKAVGPSLRQVAEETGIKYDFLRQLAAEKGQDAGPETRRKLVEWGVRHLPEVTAAFDALRATLPGDAPPPASQQPPPATAAVAEPAQVERRAYSKADQLGTKKRRRSTQGEEP